MTREEKKAEAIKRMEMLKLHENAIKEFRDEDKLNVSESIGYLYWATEAQMKVVKEFEEKYNAVVYHLIRSRMNGEEYIVYLYVSDYSGEWEMDRSDIEQGYPLAYVQNLDDELCSGFGSVGIHPSIGELSGTAWWEE